MSGQLTDMPALGAEGQEEGELLVEHLAADAAGGSAAAGNALGIAPMEGVELQVGVETAAIGVGSGGALGVVASGTDAGDSQGYALAIERLTQALMAHTALANPVASVEKTSTRTLKKQLFDAFPAPAVDTWSAETSHKFCDEVTKYLVARDFALDSKDSANWGFRCLPEHVQTQITPAGTELSPLWSGAVAFTSWRHVVEAIKSKYGAQAQRRILVLLQELRMSQGKVKEYKQEFCRLLKELDSGYMPSDNELLNILQDAMYSDLAMQEAVKWCPSAENIPVAWKPSQYAKLMDVCVSVDEALAANAAKKGVVAKGEAPKAATTQATVTNKRKATAEGGSKGAAGGAPAGRAPKRVRVKFSDIKWADPAVQAAADRGDCINCLKSGHVSSGCKEDRIKRERAADCPSNGNGNGANPVANGAKPKGRWLGKGKGKGLFSK